MGNLHLLKYKEGETRPVQVPSAEARLLDHEQSHLVETSETTFDFLSHHRSRE